MNKEKLASIPEANGFRAIAASLVFLFHVFGVLIGSPDNIAPHIPMQNLIVSGATGVTLFFLLSGFLLSRPFFYYGIRHQDPYQFLRNRILRIYPMYIAILIAAMLISGKEDILNAIKALFMIFDGRSFFPFSTPWWTLRTEVEFYVLAALVLTSAKSRLQLSIVGLLIAALGAGVFLCYVNLLPVTPRYKFLIMQSAIAYLPVFAMGILVGWMSMYSPNKKLLPTKLFIIGDIAIIFFLYMLSRALERPSREGMLALELSDFSHHYIETACWAGMLVTSIIFGSNVNRLLASKPFEWLGRISYSFYLVHLPIIVYFVFYTKGIHKSMNATWLDFSKTAVICFIAAGSVAHLTYRFIETRFLRLKTSHRA